MTTNWHWFADRVKEHLPDVSVDLGADRLTIPLSSFPKDVEIQTLCQKCEGMTIEALENQTRYQHHDLEDLMRSAHQCSACSLIQEGICTPFRSHARQGSSFDNPRDAMDDPGSERLFSSHMYITI